MIKPAFFDTNLFLYVHLRFNAVIACAQNQVLDFLLSRPMGGGCKHFDWP